ncbi:MAG: Ohr family peroxiredoxin [Albidovulum sp.]
MSTIYSTSARAAAGREGTTRLDDGTMSFDLSVPGSKKPGTNPEQLFAMGYAACFDSAAKAVARQMKLPVTATETQATVDLVKVDDGFRLAVRITLKTEGLTPDQAEDLLRNAHKMCPYSRALRGDADVTVALAN